MPSNPDIAFFYNGADKKVFSLLLIKPMRTASGVAPIAIMTKPHNCPHGRCIYCPGGLNSAFGDIPQSYTGHEPATMRGIANNYDSYCQTMNRLAQYFLTGHSPYKAEIIVMGGTFLSLPESYKKEFIAGIYKALNDFGKNFSSNKKISILKLKDFFKDSENTPELLEKMLKMKGKASLNMEKEETENEHGLIRCVALCIETKPDYAMQKQIDEMISFGTTRVETGVQTLKENVLKFTNRGHTLQDVIKSTQLLKDSFFKVAYHWMPGQPMTTKKEDIQMFSDLFSNPDFKPDGLKIYPLMVMPGTALETYYKQGKFNPLNDEDAAEIIAEGKKFVPEYCRIYRLQRDIPVKHSVTGLTKNNLRQLIKQKMDKKKIQCKCIRCREAGIKKVIEGFKEPGPISYSSISYNASKGNEVFIKAEDKKNDSLVGFCRLRLPYESTRPEITERSAGVRELHVFGTALPLHAETPDSFQHQGVGQNLLSIAEKTAIEDFDVKKLLVISGVGVKEYYKKFGFKKDGAYVSKELK